MKIMYSVFSLSVSSSSLVLFLVVADVIFLWKLINIQSVSVSIRTLYCENGLESFFFFYFFLMNLTNILEMVQNEQFRLNEAKLD